jgi:hypothetical protein
MGRGSQIFLLKKNFDTAFGGRMRVFGVKLLNRVDIQNFFFFLPPGMEIEIKFFFFFKNIVLLQFSLFKRPP